MSGEDLTASRVRRMLPSVSEVLKELTARAPVEPEIAFRAAREVCAEELKRIRDVGGESVPLEDLVQKAFLRATGASLSVPPPPPPPLVVPLYPPASAREPLADRQNPGRKIEAEDPFAETTGAMDLRWDRDAREPFSETPGSGAPAVSGPPEEEVEPDAEAPAASLVFETEPSPAEHVEMPVPFALPAEDGAPFVEPEPQAGDGPEPEAEEGPGNETLSRLSREAESIDLKAVFPMGPSSATVPFALASEDGEEREPESSLPEPVPEPFVDDEDTVLTIPRTGRSGRSGEGGGPRVGLVLGTVAGLAALAGLGYILVGLWVERNATPPPVTVARPRPTAAAVSSPPPAPAAAASTPSAPVAEGTPPPAEGTVVPAATAAAEPGPAVPPATALVAASPAPAATVAPIVLPRAIARAVPSPSNGPAPAPVPVSMAPVPTMPAAVPARQSRDGLIVTKDRAGQAQVFSIHFTSYKDRASAERDLKRVQGLAGREGYVAEVELGEKGVWYRVLVGTFETAEQAKAVRQELVAKGTRDLGWVYRVVGSDTPERR